MHSSGSLDYKVINKDIRKLLEARSELNNTIQVSMPFVKATTTIGGPSVPLLNGGIGFTIGLHAIDQDVKYEDIYASQGSDMPLIGYTYVDGKTQRVYASNQSDIITSKIFDRRAALFTNSKDFVRIPPPGITNVTIGRNKNGLLAHGQLTITIPSLSQLESLQKTFLVPGIGMILEWGQQFAQTTKTSGVGELPDISSYMFPWNDRGATLEILNKLARNKLGLQEILNDYVYKAQGQYMWMFGRVANFSINTLADGGFQSVVKIVGPSEDSWAYSTKNTVVPAKDESTKFFCASDTNSVYGYFTDTSAGGLNLKTLLDDVKNGAKLTEWKDHVVFFSQGNKKGGDPKPDEPKPNTSQNSFADLEDAYFMTWRFFVNVVLNDPAVGLKRIFSTVVEKETLEKIGMLLSYADGLDRKKPVATKTLIDDPLEAFTGYNKFLRSIDPSVMIIVNEEAANLASANPQYKSPVVEQDFLKETPETKQFKNVGQYDTAAEKYNTPGKKDRSFLSTGVWLNHKTVVEAMIGGDTIVRGISNLLDRMNSATLGYWDLNLDMIEPEKGKDHSYNYMVIDANVKENSINAVSKFIDEVHVFNKYVRTDTATGKLVGSELVECSIDLSLPKRLFSQIATLGLVQPEDLQNAGISSGSASDPVDYTNQKTAKISDPNDTLRKLYAITVLSPESDSEQGPDLTVLPRTQKSAQLAANGICGKANVQTPAQTAGNSNKAAGISPEETTKYKSSKEMEEAKKEAQKLLDTDACKKCKQCLPPPSAQAGENISFPPDANLNQAAASLLSREEGLPRGGKAYYDPPSQQALVSIGYGHQIKQDEYSQGYIQAGDERIPLNGIRGIDTVLTPTQAKKLLEIDVQKYVNSARVPLGDAWNKLTINQKVALTSYAYNTGSTRSLVRAGILNTIDQNDSAGTAQIIRDKGTRTANGQVLQVLVNRRSREATLFARDPIGKSTTTSNTPTPTSTGCTDQYYLDLSGGKSPDAGKELCKKCERANQTVQQATKLSQEEEKVKGLVEKSIREFGGLQQLFRYVEIFPEYMVAQITDAADGNFANAFGASPGSLSIGGDLVMPGIAGLRVGELFWIDRLPSFYKSFGAFQILSIEDTINVDGWKTKIHARFNYLGKSWQAAMAEKINTEINNVGSSSR